MEVTDARMISIFYILRHAQLKIEVCKEFEVSFRATDFTQILVIQIKTVV